MCLFYKTLATGYLITNRVCLKKKFWTLYFGYDQQKLTQSWCKQIKLTSTLDVK